MASFPNFIAEMDPDDIATITKNEGSLQAGLSNPETRDIAQGLIDQKACACHACCNIALGNARYALKKVGTNG